MSPDDGTDPPAIPPPIPAPPAIPDAATGAAGPSSAARARAGAKPASPPIAAPVAAEGIDALVAALATYNPRSDGVRIRAAHAYAARAHAGQTRRSGEPYITHPAAVAGILAGQRMDDATVITALLHDTVEDTGSTSEEIARLFGPDIAGLVDGVTKLTNFELTSHQTKQAENFRKLFMAMAQDMRVIVVKLADRLHNMRTLGAMPDAKREQKARETMEIFAPLAGRMGMQSVREELEDLAFQVLDPVARASVMRRFATLRQSQGDVVEEITEDLTALLARSGVPAQVMGRAKRPYSIWRKMEAKDLTFQRLSDIWGFRVVTENEDGCYVALGAIHRRWAAVPGRFKDYISQPKQNGYRSIHTTVSGRDAKRVEIQIRSREMHDVAESGIAAHWSYRDGAPGQNRFAVDPSRWVAAMAERFGEGGTGAENDEDFLEAVKLEMYADQVFCFTPRGDVVKLPKGATPIDFAYAIHTRIGDACVGARVDGRRQPLTHRLRNGQSVEILTAEGSRPQGVWLEEVVTGRAKAAIRRSLRAEGRERFIRLGRELARAAFAAAGGEATPRLLTIGAERMGVSDADELLARIGSTEISAREVAAVTLPGGGAAPGPDAALLAGADPVVGLGPDQRPVRGTCCGPVPGERIIGITFRGEGVVLHAADCPALMAFEDAPERWVDTRWTPGRHPPIHPVTLDLTIANTAGVLGRVCTAIGGQGANIADLAFTDAKPDFYRIRVQVEVSDAAHLHRVTTALSAEDDVAEMRRRRGEAHGQDGPRGSGRARPGLPDSPRAAMSGGDV